MTVRNYPAFARMVEASTDENYDGGGVRLVLCNRHEIELNQPKGSTQEPMPLLPEDFLNACQRTLAQYLLDEQLPLEFIPQVVGLVEMLKELKESEPDPKAVATFLYGMTQLVWDIDFVRGHRPSPFPPDKKQEELDSETLWSLWFGKRKVRPTAPQNHEMRITLDGMAHNRVRAAIYQRLKDYRDSGPIRNMQPQDKRMIDDLIRWGLESQGAISISSQVLLRIQGAYPDLNLAYLLLGVGLPSILETQNQYHHTQPAPTIAAQEGHNGPLPNEEESIHTTSQAA